MCIPQTWDVSKVYEFLYEITIILVVQNTFDDKSILVQVMTISQEATTSASVNLFRPKQNGRHFSDDISKHSIEWKCMNSD